MKHKNKFEFTPKIILAVFTGICILLLVASVCFSSTKRPFNAIAGVTIVPMQKGINSIGVFVENQFAHLKNARELQAENEKLQEKLDNLQTENHLLKQDQYELERLRTMYDLDQQYKKYKKVAARIISGGSGNWFNVFIIDKGSKDGLAVNMNVIAGSGLVGIVTEVGDHYAKVRSIIDDTSNVSAMFVRTSDQCTLVGSQKEIENGYIDVININKDAKVNDGDELVTSNVSSKFLPGITIGYVTDIKMESSNLVKNAKLSPIVDFKHLQEVFVITELKKVK